MDLESMTRNNFRLAVIPPIAVEYFFTVNETVLIIKFDRIKIIDSMILTRIAGY